MHLKQDFNMLVNIQQYKPSGGFGKLSLLLLRQLKNILLLCADPFHPTQANVNFMSKSQAHVIICWLPFPSSICMLVMNW